MNMSVIICKNDLCSHMVPASKNSGRQREFCQEVCRNRYNARLYYKRQTKGATFTGLRNVVDGYPRVKRKPSPDVKAAERRVKEHGENCTGPGEWCKAKLHDAYNMNKLCLVRAVFTDDWLQLMYADTEPDRERDMTTEEGMWKDDFQAMLAKSGITETDIKTVDELTVRKELDAFAKAGGMKNP